MVNGTFSDNGTGTLQNLYNSLFYNWEPDNYLVLYDLADYIRVKLIANSEYGTEEFVTKSLMPPREVTDLGGHPGQRL